MSARPLRRAGILVAVTSMIIGMLSTGGTAQAAPAEPVSRPACSEPAAGAVRCLSVWRPAPSTARVPAGTVAPPTEGYVPADIRSAYKLPATGGSGQVIAIVDAYDNPRVEADLTIYRRVLGLPPCTSANGCFRKVDQRGGTDYPQGDVGWGVEIALDVQAVSAACPGCQILLVEADDNSFQSIGTAVNTAVRLGADVVSNSYGADEFTGINNLGRKFFTHPGVPIVVSSGDYGFTAASFPAVMSSSWAVGGTTLTRKSDGGWKETAWYGAGSGCSAWVQKPAWQKDANCGKRTTSDVSALADPDPGFAVYDTYGLGADNGWITVGGTSVSAPLVSGMIGLAGNAQKVASPSWLYSHRGGLYDVVGGSNGFCGGDYLCTGVKGYDGPTGLGAPRGLGSL